MKWVICYIHEDLAHLLISFFFDEKKNFCNFENNKKIAYLGLSYCKWRQYIRIVYHPTILFTSLSFLFFYLFPISPVIFIEK
jgi:hypothetical protein